MGIPLLEGRDFTEEDVDGRQPVAIVSRSFARKYFPGQSAVAKRVRGPGKNAPWWTIAGVVSDVRYMGLETAPPMQFYAPLWQVGVNSVNVAVRTGLPADRMASAMRAVVRSLDPAIAAADVRTMSQLVSEATAERRFQTFLLTAFGAAALFLSLVGLYALIAYSVQQRTGEIGIRMALGAQRSTVMRMVLKQGTSLALIGSALGIVSALGVTRLMTSLLFEIKPTDATTFLSAAVLFCAVALAACYIPARRATKVDPMISLRYE